MSTVTPLRRDDREAREPPSNDRLLELAQQFIPTCVELGPLDREDIREAMLELYHRRKAEAEAAKGREQCSA